MLVARKHAAVTRITVSSPGRPSRGSFECRNTCSWFYSTTRFQHHSLEFVNKMTRSSLLIALLVVLSFAQLQGNRVFTKDELAKYDGSDVSSAFCYLVPGHTVHLVHILSLFQGKLADLHGRERTRFRCLQRTW